MGQRFWKPFDYSVELLYFENTGKMWYMKYLVFFRTYFSTRKWDFLKFYCKNMCAKVGLMKLIPIPVCVSCGCIWKFTSLSRSVWYEHQRTDLKYMGQQCIVYSELIICVSFFQLERFWENYITHSILFLQIGWTFLTHKVPVRFLDLFNDMIKHVLDLNFIAFDLKYLKV